MITEMRSVNKGALSEKKKRNQVKFALLSENDKVLKKWKREEIGLTTSCSHM